MASDYEFDFRNPEQYPNVLGDTPTTPGTCYPDIFVDKACYELAKFIADCLNRWSVNNHEMIVDRLREETDGVLQEAPEFFPMVKSLHTYKKIITNTAEYPYLNVYRELDNVVGSGSRDSNIKIQYGLLHAQLEFMSGTASWVSWAIYQCLTFKQFANTSRRWKVEPFNKNNRPLPIFYSPPQSGNPHATILEIQIKLLST